MASPLILIVFFFPNNRYTLLPLFKGENQYPLKCDRWTRLFFFAIRAQRISLLSILSLSHVNCLQKLFMLPVGHLQQFTLFFFNCENQQQCNFIPLIQYVHKMIP